MVVLMGSKVMLKILQARLQQYVNHELPDIQARFRKGRGTRDQIGNICWIIEKVRDSRKHLLLLYWVCQSLWLCGSKHTGKFFKKWEYETTLPAWEICMQIKKQQLELDMEQQERKKKLLSHVQLFVTLWTVAYQAPLSMGFSRQRYWSGLPFPPPGDLPDSGIEHKSPTLQADTLPSEPSGKPGTTDRFQMGNE